ncbi:hypothetical protein MUN82_11640 [Hymenobacter aerilatus]|uniref:Curli assembly protein CsgC n=1 Tax=Hymenobacter aerilatus TaxID=2932251 RepID=A0A8T9STQ9_9BACT|nr:curli-like amyloid fiber formation chaperone CsgH [Hymenobacter aerilatus]UOR03600.1 hypothetical protein MUN82_11640 [Hymenobacter aerilatus]
MLLSILHLLVLGCLLTYQGREIPCEAKLLLEHDETELHITGYCRSQSSQPASYRYELQVAKRSRGGQATSRQSGEFEVMPGQTVRLSHVAVNAGSAYTGQLRIYTRAGVLLARDSVGQTTPTP